MESDWHPNCVTPHPFDGGGHPFVGQFCVCGGHPFDTHPSVKLQLKSEKHGSAVPVHDWNPPVVHPLVPPFRLSDSNEATLDFFKANCLRFTCFFFMIFRFVVKG